MFGCSHGLAGQNHLIVINCNVQIHILIREAVRIEEKVLVAFSPVFGIVSIFKIFTLFPKRKKKKLFTIFHVFLVFLKRIF